MVFSSFFFLFAFLPATLLLYHLAPLTVKNPLSVKNWVLLLCSLAFYFWGEPTFLPIVLICCVVDYLIGSYLAHSIDTGHRRHRLLVVSAGVAFNLALLGYFKYANFFVEQGNRALGLIGLQQLAWSSVVLPIGISFFVFHEISYLVDLYRGNAKPARSLRDYLLYILFFPQLIAGPIIRYHDIAEQLVKRVITSSDCAYGIWRFALGLAKKVLIADQLGAVASHVFDNPTAELPLGFAWIGVLSYSLQIYYDFSGYSDMALGLARMFGFKIIENFDQPYLSRNFNEFWRRWHISLTAFMREYLYVAIGGNRYGRLRTYLNLWIVFLLSGFWHGASWNFLIWGAFHGFFLSLNKLATEQGWPRPPRVVGVATTFLLVSLGWVVFRSETLADAAAILSALFDFSAGAYAMAPAELISNRGAATLVFASVATFISWERFAVFTRQASSDPLVVALRGLLAVLFFCFSLTALAASGFSPFLYFKF